MLDINIIINKHFSKSTISSVIIFTSDNDNTLKCKSDANQYIHIHISSQSTTEDI